MKEKIDFVVVTCSAYGDVASLTIKEWSKKLNLSLFRLWIFSDEQITVDNKDWTLVLGHEKSWAKNLLNCLSRFNSEFLIIVLEDFYPRSIFDQQILFSSYRYCIQNEIDLLSMTRRVRRGKVRKKGSPEIYEINDSEFAISLQPGIWKVSTFREMLINIDTPLEFEVRNSSRNLIDYRILTTQDLLHCQGFFSHHLIEKGRWIWSEYWLLKYFYRASISTGTRKVMSFRESLYLEIKEVFRASRLFLPLFLYSVLRRVWRNLS